MIVVIPILNLFEPHSQGQGVQNGVQKGYLQIYHIPHRKCSHIYPKAPVLVLYSLGLWQCMRCSCKNFVLYALFQFNFYCMRYSENLMYSFWCMRYGVLPSLFIYFCVFQSYCVIIFLLLSHDLRGHLKSLRPKLKISVFFKLASEAIWGL